MGRLSHQILNSFTILIAVIGMTEKKNVIIVASRREFNSSEELSNAITQVIKDTISSVISAIDEVLVHVAVRTGEMKEAIISRMIAILSEALNVNNYDDAKLIADLNDYEIDLMAELVFYLVYHTRRHPEFNPKFSSGYKNPTTPNTKPFDRLESIDEFISLFRTLLDLNLRRAGLL